MMLTLKRAYEPEARSDGTRILVERLWPRGLSKKTLHVDAWLKDVAPSTELRQWFSHDPEKWPRFRARYFQELDSGPEAVASHRDGRAARHGHARLQFTRHDAQQRGRAQGLPGVEDSQGTMILVP